MGLGPLAQVTSVCGREGSAVMRREKEDYPDSDLCLFSDLCRELVIRCVYE